MQNAVCKKQLWLVRVGGLGFSLLFLLIFTGGCATDARQFPLTTEDDREKADFYWPYAALAADVYRTRGEVDSSIATALASPWLRAEIAAAHNNAASAKYEKISYPEAESIYRDRLRERCQIEQQLHPSAEDVAASTPSCVAEAEARAEDEATLKNAYSEPNRFQIIRPKRKEDCEAWPGHDPAVPVDSVTGDYGWSRVPELQKQTQARGWRLFVPELAIDVWRRKRSGSGQPLVMEYAVVYRGTVGGGGWVSNLRGITSITPLVWDQYEQARLATTSIIGQVDRLHAMYDDLLKPKEATQVLFTTVGHSLGGGLARYMYLRVPRVTRVVAFNPSPIDGSGTISLEKRKEISASTRRLVDLETKRDLKAAMHVLFEDGEAVSLIMPCHSGALWGDEGGPWVRCERVNLSKGSIFTQHNMPQLACKLFLVREGIPAR